MKYALKQTNMYSPALIRSFSAWILSKIPHDFKLDIPIKQKLIKTVFPEIPAFKTHLGLHFHNLEPECSSSNTRLSIIKIVAYHVENTLYLRAKPKQLADYSSEDYTNYKTLRGLGIVYYAAVLRDSKTMAVRENHHES